MAFSLSHGDYEVREAKYSWREERLTSFCKTCLRSDEEPKNGQIYTMYHGTTLEAAEQIISYGFKPSNSGMLGKGIYVSRDEDKAASYPLKEKERRRQVILELRVNVGKVKKIDYQGHPLQKSWHDDGYDTAWVPPGCGMVDSEREEDCVWNPNRIQVTDVVKAPKKALRHLKILVEHHNRKKYLGGDEEPRNDQVYTMYHGTTLDAAEQIIAHGFTPSKGGMLGKGVYVTRDEDKAASYPLKETKERHRQVILELRVNVGKVKKIDYQGHPLQDNWHDHGFDTAWVPPGCGMVPSGREEDCVWDPNRIQVIDVVKAPKGSLLHLQNLIKEHDPGFHKMALTTKKLKKKNIHIMYHATTVTAAEHILARGFKCVPHGVLGKGVYITRYENKVTRELLDDENEEAYQVMLQLKVNVGKVLVLDTKSHPLKETWYKIYDTVWMSPASGILKSGLGDFCVRVPNRIKVIGIEKAPESSLAHLQTLMKKKASGSCKSYRRRSKRANNKNVCIINHGTTMEAAENVIRNGFQSSLDGVVGKGVYLCKYTDNTRGENVDRHCEVIMELWVNIGKDIKIDYQGHQLRTTWYKSYDTVFMPGGCAIVSSGLDEYCVRNPSRIKLVDIIKAPGNSRVHLQNLAEKYVQGFCLKCERKQVIRPL
uniref:PARP catalytic domain-containing protein n=1 Tax=Leptobrachium leishanense TaxID=445787 RepID=A0A8C5MV78_9ANUR